MGTAQQRDPVPPAGSGGRALTPRSGASERGAPVPRRSVAPQSSVPKLRQARRGRHRPAATRPRSFGVSGCRTSPAVGRLPSSGGGGRRPAQIGWRGGRCAPRPHHETDRFARRPHRRERALAALPLPAGVTAWGPVRLGGLRQSYRAGRQASEDDLDLRCVAFRGRLRHSPGLTGGPPGDAQAPAPAGVGLLTLRSGRLPQSDTPGASSLAHRATLTWVYLVC